MKKFLTYTAAGLLVLIVLAALLPVFFKGKIVSMVKKEINKSLLAKVEFSDVSISLFRHFPKLSVALEDVSVVGINEFVKDTLLSARRADAALHLWSAIRGEQMQVYGVYLESPRINALVNREGKANWEITKPDTAASATETTGSSIRLDEYRVTNGYVFYRDETSGMEAEIERLNHNGSGHLAQDAFTLSTKTSAATVRFVYGGIPYLAGAKTGIDADFIIDTKKSRYGFQKAAIAVNDLKLTADGFIQLDNDSTYTMDVRFDAPSNAFKDFLSLVPAVYKNDFGKLKTSGTAALKGFVQGVYGPKQLPAYNVTLQVKDGFFQYPDLPQPVKNIQVLAQFSNPDGQPDNTVVDIQKAHLEMGDAPFDVKLLFKRPETIRYIDATVKGKLNLAHVGNFTKLEPGTVLSGLVQADAYAKGALAALQQGGGTFSAGGFFNIQNFDYAAKGLPQPLRNGNFDVQVENKGGVADATTINVSKGHIEVGNDPVDFSVQVEQPVTAIRFKGKAKGKMNLENIQRFVALEGGTSVKGMLEADVAFSGSKADIDQGAYERIHVEGLANIAGLRYVSTDYPEGIAVSSASLQFSPQHAHLNTLKAHYKGTAISGSGSLQNMIGYALGKGELGGVLDIAADKVALNNWISSDTATADTAATGVFQVPEHINLTLHAKADDVLYDKVNYRNVAGTLLLKDQTVRLQDVSTQALGGSITFNGGYSTRQSKSKPHINMNYTITNVDVQQAFFAFNTMQKLMPVGKFLSGKLNSQFSLSGTLNGQMLPELGSLTGKGNFIVIQGLLSKFQPMEKLAASLNVADLNNFSVKDLKTYFEFADGKVLVKPFTVKVKDIEMQIGGIHGLDQSMDYLIGMKVPRSYLGTAGNNLVNGLAAQATKKGVPVHLGEMIDLNIKLGGTITSPLVKTDLREAAGDATKELKQQATAFVQQKRDSAKQVVTDSFQVVKKQVMEDAKQSLLKSLAGKEDTAAKAPALQETKEKATQTVKNTLNGLFGKKKPAN
jgi:hypothetical protein